MASRQPSHDSGVTGDGRAARKQVLERIVLAGETPRETMLPPSTLEERTTLGGSNRREPAQRGRQRPQRSSGRHASRHDGRMGRASRRRPRKTGW